MHKQQNDLQTYPILKATSLAHRQLIGTKVFKAHNFRIIERVCMQFMREKNALTDSKH